MLYHTIYIFYCYAACHLFVSLIVSTDLIKGWQQAAGSQDARHIWCKMKISLWLAATTWKWARNCQAQNQINAACVSKLSGFFTEYFTTCFFKYSLLFEILVLVVIEIWCPSPIPVIDKWLLCPILVTQNMLDWVICFLWQGLDRVTIYQWQVYDRVSISKWQLSLGFWTKRSSSSYNVEIAPGETIV